MTLGTLLWFAVPALAMAGYAYFTHARLLCFLPSLVATGAYLLCLAIDSPVLAPMRRKLPEPTLAAVFATVSLILLAASLAGVYGSRNLNAKFLGSLPIQGIFIFYLWFWVVRGFFSTKP
jgi:hypothetical protein